LAAVWGALGDAGGLPLERNSRIWADLQHRQAATDLKDSPFRVWGWDWERKR
jgi:hypothetical protein